MSKYYSTKIKTSDGIVFDSQREAQRWVDLKLLEKAGKIRDLKRQVKYVLIPALYDATTPKKTLLERECFYKADFTYIDEDGKLHVEDVKGYRTKDYIIKRKLMLFIHNIRIWEV